jgi:hypothetical protein
MLPQTSSTSSSNRSRQVLWILIFTIGGLAFADFGLGHAFRHPDDPSRRRPSSAQQLFDGGRAVSGRLRRMTQMAEAPWWISGNWVGQPQVATTHSGGQPRVALFGNSFMARQAHYLQEMYPESQVSACIGTFSPPSQALGCYRQVRRSLDADVAVMGILTSTWPLAHSFSNASYAFTNPESYTYPIYSVNADGSLHEEMPLVRTRADLDRRFRDPDFDERWLAQLAAHDRRYNPLLYDETALDHSTLVRLSRRALANWVRRHVEQSYEGPASLEPKLWGALVKEFAREVREDGRVPIVVLFHDIGFGDDLYRALEPVLDGEQIAVVSSHRLFDANDLSNFGKDRHYIEANDRRVTASLIDTIQASLVHPL